MGGPGLDLKIWRSVVSLRGPWYVKKKRFGNRSWKQSPRLQTESYQSAQIPLTWLCLIASAARWAWHPRTSCYEMAHLHPLLFLSPSICFLLYPLLSVLVWNLIPADRLYVQVRALMGAIITFYRFLSPVLSPPATLELEKKKKHYGHYEHMSSLNGLRWDS